VARGLISRSTLFQDSARHSHTFLVELNFSINVELEVFNGRSSPEELTSSFIFDFLIKSSNVCRLLASPLSDLKVGSTNGIKGPCLVECWKSCHNRLTY